VGDLRPKLTRVLIVAAILSNLITAWEMSRVVLWLQIVSHLLDGGCIHP
jgi:hypothetical protein